MRRSTSVWWLTASAGIWFTGCSVDDRALIKGTPVSLNDGGLTDASAANDSNDAEASAPENGSDGASSGDDAMAENAPDSGSGSAAHSGCQILADSPLTLTNTSFDTDTTGWSIESTADGDWSSNDAKRNATSGSLAVTNKTVLTSEGLTMGGARQCVAIDSSTVYQVCTEYYLEGEPQGGAGAISVWLYDGPDCSGNVVASETSSLEGAASLWATSYVRAQAPSNALSMLVRLVAVKPFRQQPLKVYFDNVRAGVSGY